MNKMLKLGDKVSAEYGNVTVTGIIDGFAGGWVMLKFQEPQDLGNRIESDSVGIRPCDRSTLKLIEAGPELTEKDVFNMPLSVGGGSWLRNKA